MVRSAILAFVLVCLSLPQLTIAEDLGVFESLTPNDRVVVRSMDSGLWRITILRKGEESKGPFYLVTVVKRDYIALQAEKPVLETGKRRLLFIPATAISYIVRTIDDPKAED